MRQTIDMNRTWRFHPGEAENAFYQGYDDRAWRAVTLPHDWSVEAPFDPACSSGTGYLPGGVGWYRKTFTLPEDIGDKKVYVTFGGVYQHSRCWINSHYLGMRAYGYSTFRYELTGRVKPGENVLCVRAEHLHLADSRWFTGAGIYRGVTLTIVPAAHASDLFGYTVTADAEMAEIAVNAEIACGRASFRLLDTEGRLVARSLGKAGKEAGCVSALLQVPSPRLWSPETPYLYRLCCVVTEHGRKMDELSVPFGVRTLRFDPNEGFFLNGENRKLKGVCLHHDAGALGAAVPLSVWQTRLQKLMDAGCNAVRFSHNPADPEVLSLCDRLGLMVMEEAFDEWEGCKNKWCNGHNVYPPQHYGYSDDFPQWHTQDLEDMVRFGRNHPSVILWSIGNEIDYPNDPYVHPAFAALAGNNDANKPDEALRYDPNRPDISRLTVVAREMATTVRRLDPSRPVTMALAAPALSNLVNLPEELDVVGYNYMEERYAEDHRQYPKRIIYGSENHQSPEAWQAVLHNPRIAGQFLWTGADFLGEARGWPVRVSTAGLLDTANHEKPLYCLRKALWTEPIYAKLAASREGDIYAETFGWEYREGETVTVSVYTNAAEATLYVNGEAQGTVTVGEDAHAVWQVAYHPGQLRAVCKRGKETAEDALETTGAPTALALRCNRKSLPADGQTVATLELSLTDGEGRVPTDADESVTVQVTGDAAVIGFENGNPADLTPFASPARPTWHGRAVIYLRAGTLPCEITLTAWTRGGLKKSIKLEQRRA
ncbi:MAG TPA: glycoside hydrolase family 2 TIM barrel-domain containing protein [Candidatus Limiplasma sp.]|nr:glycoside hydrolase family 2 TIM barrel-domain containing protein [Candidatus Limiplasma sp.]